MGMTATDSELLDPHYRPPKRVLTLPFLVYTDGGQPLQCSTRAVADAEARRLAADHPGIIWNVYALVAAAQTPWVAGVLVEMDAGAAEPDMGFLEMSASSDEKAGL